MTAKKTYESGYDPNRDEAYSKARQKLETARQNKPVYSSPYGEESRELYRQLQSRQPFSYDASSDALYRQYRDQYIRQGRLAMEDTLGSAQAMTGGYGNSYAQSAAQQTYQNYLSQLGDKLPELYNQALERYRLEGEQLQSRYDRAQAQEEQSYARYQDALADYNKDVAFLQSQADQAWDRGYSSYLEGYRMNQDAYERMIYLMEKRGYRPTRQELLDIGFTADQAAILGR